MSFPRWLKHSTLIARIEWTRRRRQFDRSTTWRLTSVLGAVITGDTDHDEVVTHAAARQCSEVSLARDTPVTFGVSGPAMSEEQARDRVEYCADAVDAAIDLVAELPEPT